MLRLALGMMSGVVCPDKKWRGRFVQLKSEDVGYHEALQEAHGGRFAEKKFISRPAHPLETQGRKTDRGAGRRLKIAVWHNLPGGGGTGTPDKPVRSLKGRGAKLSCELIRSAKKLSASDSSFGETLV